MAWVQKVDMSACDEYRYSLRGASEALVRSLGQGSREGYVAFTLHFFLRDCDGGCERGSEGTWEILGKFGRQRARGVPGRG